MCSKIVLLNLLQFYIARLFHFCLSSKTFPISWRHTLVAWTPLTFFFYCHYFPRSPSTTLDPLRLCCKIASLSLFSCDFYHRCCKILHTASHLHHVYFSNLEEKKENTASVNLPSPRLSPHEIPLYISTSGLWNNLPSSYLSQRPVRPSCFGEFCVATLYEWVIPSLLLPYS